MPGSAARGGPGAGPQVRGNPLLRALLARPRSPRLSVLIYHRVLAERDSLRPTEPTAGEFEARMAWVKAHFDVLPMVEAVERMKSGSLPARALAITFDDGYADNHDLALPILQRLGMPATFFVATGYLDGGRMFNDTVIEAVRQAEGDMLDLGAVGFDALRIRTDDERRKAVETILAAVMHLPPAEREDRVEAVAARIGARLPTHLMMTSAQVAALSRAGMEIGGHTISHPILARVPIEAAAREIGDGRRALEAMTRRPVRVFAYPRGRPNRDYTSAHVALVREQGFDAAFSTAWGACPPGGDAFQIPRFTPWDVPAWKFGLRVAINRRQSSYELA